MDKKLHRKIDGGGTSSHTENGKILKYIEEKSKLVYGLHCLSGRDFNKRAEDETMKDYFAALPPLDSFIKVDKVDALSHDWKLFEIGDIVFARVSSIHEHGISAGLLAMGYGKSRDVEKHKFRVWCSVSEIPKENNHEDVLLRFTSGDMLCCTILKINMKDHELTVSMHRQKGMSSDIPLGKIEDENLPITYRRQLVAEDSYENMLRNSVGFANPSNVEYLMSKLGVQGKNVISLMENLHQKHYSKNDYAEILRKKQSRNIAEKIIKDGVEKFKSQKFIEALQDFNRALDMDTENVDAFVARGALYANRGSFSRSISDFENALKLQSTNKNAKKYLVEVLVERAKQIESQIEDVPQVMEVEKLYMQALHLDANCDEAKQALGKIRLKKQKAEKSPDSSTDSSKGSDNNFAETAEKLRKILKSEKKSRTSSQSSSKSLKKNINKLIKKKRSSKSDSDSSSTTSSSCSSSSSSNESSPDLKSKSHRNSSSSLDIKSQSKEKTPESLRSERRRKSSSDQKGHRSLSIRHEPYKTNSISNRRHSSGGQTNYHATIQSSNSHPSVNKTRDRRSLPVSDVSKKQKVLYDSETKSHTATNLTKITKDNFQDILKEIKKFESSK